jgi:S1-C subfamily serine protease
MPLTGLESQVTGAIEKLSESVVGIDSTKLTRDYRYGLVPIEGQGSGVIIDPGGTIVTNHHVIDDASKVQVHLKDGRTLVGEVIGSDEATDIALVRVKAENLPSAALGDSESLKVGQFVLAIGNALGLPGAPTVSMGVISALGRPLPGTDFVLEGLVQTDAAINPGNSGGPLADLDGRVIGINTAMIPFAQGVGFAIPSGTIKRIIEQISKNGRVVRPWLGISGLDVNPSIARRYGLSVESGVLLAEVMRDSPAHAAGLREGDIVVGIGETKVEQMKGLVTALSKSTIGDRVTVSFVRTGTTYEADIRLAETPTPLLTRRR